MASRNLSIGFIGIGVLGKGLPLALAERGYRVAAAYSRSSVSAQWLADRIPGCTVYASAQELSDAVDLVFITTPDSAIQEVTSSLNWRSGQGVVHCYGGASIELLKPAADQGALTGAFHPFQTFAGLANPEEAAARLSGVTFAVEGEGWLDGYLSGVAEDLGGHAVTIPGQDRPLYHAAAVFGCGYLVALMQTAVSLWEAMGFSSEQAIQALIPLSTATIGNIAQGGLVVSATGPAVRGDVQTLHSHLEALFQRSPELVILYGNLARASLPLAMGHGVGPNQLNAIEELVDHYTSID
jgi:predicted short-subunit dehydrogenase-like oxidoreductase (DUF2520 family)